MQDVAVVQVTQTFEQLQHVAFDLRFGKMDIGVGRHARQVVVHVGTHHVESGALLYVFCSVGQRQL